MGRSSLFLLEVLDSTVRREESSPPPVLRQASLITACNQKTVTNQRLFYGLEHPEYERL